MPALHRVPKEISGSTQLTADMMKCSILALIAICCCIGTGYAQAAAPAPAPANNFYLELKSIVRNVPLKEIERLFRTYALNDAEFQSVLREINTLPAYRVRRQLLNQPELRQFVAWIAQQLALSGGSLKIFDEFELEFKLFNKYPQQAQSVNGIAGFQQEFTLIYPVTLLRSLLENGAQQSPNIAELWRRLVALKPFYERFIATPPVQALIERLRALGVDVNGIDSLIRYQFGWSNETARSYDYDYVTLL